MNRTVTRRTIHSFCVRQTRTSRIWWRGIILFSLASLSCSSPSEDPVAAAQLASHPEAEAADSAPVTPAPGGPPRLVFGDIVFDFGKVEQGTQVNHLFDFTN